MLLLKSIGKNVAKILVFLALLILLNKGISYLVVDDVNSVSRAMMTEFYQLEGDTEALFLGSSHVYRAIDTSILNEYIDGTIFNAGSSSQQIDLTYALLKEHAKDNTVKVVYLELYYGAINTTPYNERSASSIGSFYNATDYMPFSLNKLSLLLNMSSPEYYINSFLPAKRYWKNLFEIRNCMTYIKKKQQSDYQDLIIKIDTTEYMGAGFVANYAQLEEYATVSATDFSTYIPSDDWLNTFYEMYEYCQEHDIELILYSAAMPVETLASGDYDIYIEQMYSIIEDTDLTYIDFNLAKKELLVTEPSDFFDSQHLNYYGAQKQTEALYQVYYELENPEDYFYDTFYEKLVDLYPEYLEEAAE